MNAALNRVVNDQCGFITSNDILEIGKEYPTMQVLVRTGTNRYVCGLEDLTTVFDNVSKKGDYVRDVCLTAENHERIKNGSKPYTMTRIHQVHPDA